MPESALNYIKELFILILMQEKNMTLIKTKGKQDPSTRFTSSKQANYLNVRFSAPEPST